jgi:hypothetical protein
MSNLIPEARTDKNGRTVIRHVRAEEGAPTTKSPALLRPPAAIKRQQDMSFLDMRLKQVASDDYFNEELELDLDFDKLRENANHLNDIELPRFAMYLDHTEEETAAFLMLLDRGDYDLVSDMTLIYDAQRHAGAPADDEDDWEYIPDPHSIVSSIINDHESVKRYMRRTGVEYTKLDALSAGDRARALQWLNLLYETKDSFIEGISMDFDETTHQMSTSFKDPEFEELAMSNPRVIELAKEHGTHDVERIKAMLSHEASLTAGVL